jgi:hypothetical protein
MKYSYANLILVILISFAFYSSFASAFSPIPPWQKDIDKVLGEGKSDITDGSIANNPLQTGESSHPEISFPSLASPLNVTKKILSPRREAGYFMDDVIEVQVTVTSSKEEDLENVEIWEIPTDGLEIINCSYPIETATIYQKLDYEKSDKSNIAENDILNISQIKYELMNSKKTSKQIRNLLSPQTRKNLNDLNYSEARLKADIVDDFNRILNNKTNMDLNASFFSPSPTVLNDGLDYWIDNNTNSTEYMDFINFEDYRLIKRRLLELAFKNDSINANSSKGIRWLPFSKQHENLPIYKIGELEAIIYRPENLREGESVVFKYYLRPKKRGTSEVRSIIKSNGYLYDVATPIKIIERDPNFEYAYWCESKDLSKDAPVNFTYVIKYMGGDKDERENFTVHIAPIGPCEVKSITVRKDNKTVKNLMEKSSSLSLPLNFTKGLLKEIIVNAVYTKTGSMYSPPAISIENSTSKFNADISVHGDQDHWFQEHYAAITTFIFSLTLIISSIGLATIYFQRKQIEQAKEGVNTTQTLISNNTTALEKLKDIIDNGKNRDK